MHMDNEYKLDVLHSYEAQIAFKAFKLRKASPVAWLWSQRAQAISSFILMPPSVISVNFDLLSVAVWEALLDE